MAQLLLLILLACQAQPVADPDPDGPVVEAAQLTAENWQKFAPAGKEVDAVIGDLVLRNGYLTAVIAQPLESRHANAVDRDVGGAVIDLATRVNGSDQLQAYRPGQRQFAYRKWRMLDNDRKEFQGATSSSNQLTVEVSSAATDRLPEVRVEYILESDEPFLVVVTSFINKSEKRITVPLADEIRFDPAQEYQDQIPDGVGPLFWNYDRHWGQAYGILSLSLVHEMRSVPASQFQGAATALSYRANNGQTSVILEPQGTFRYGRWILPASSLLDIKSAALEMQGEDLELVKLRVTGNGRPLPQAHVALQRNGISYGGATTDAQGLIETRLPVGTYTAAVSSLGIPLKSDKPLRAIVVAGLGGTIKLDLPQYRPGNVVAKITDALGSPIPCKVEFQAKDGKPQPDFGPESGDFGVKNLRYSLGSFEQPLPPGEYDVIVSHGPEYDAVFRTLKVEPGESIELTAQLQRTVNTTGWISSDFHSKSTYSGDNTCSPAGRLLNLMAEQIEFAPSAERDRIVSYAPMLDDLQAGRFLGTSAGVELWKPPGAAHAINALGAFPLQLVPQTQDGGAPPTEGDFAAQIERLIGWDNASEKLLQANHPDFVRQFYDREGDGKPDAAFAQKVSRLHAVALHPLEFALNLQPTVDVGKDKVANPVFAWLQLLNQGARIAAVANSGATTNFHGSGRLRNWVRSATDDPASVKPADVVRAARAGQMVVSNGPFLEVSAGEAGQDLAAASGKIELKLRVQCPNWLDIDRVTVLVNGRPHGVHQYSRATHPEKFREKGAVRFDETLLLDLKQDAHLIVVAGGEALKLGPVAGPRMRDTPPTAVSNPIYVDVDGGGFKANLDMLGPLPPKTP